MVTRAAQPVAMPAGLSRDDLLKIYYYLRLTRSLEERLVNLYRQTKVIGGLYCSLGQEGESVGSAYALEPGDMLSPLIRNLGALLVKGASPIDMLRQYMAKGTGPSHGRDTNVHFVDLERGYIGNISHLGDMVPVMAGIALSFKLQQQARVGLVYIGDGAASTGAFHEGTNFAAVLRLPLILVLEHNGYAYSTPTAQQTAVPRLALKAKAYGIPAETVDGNDVLAVYQATRQAVARARHGGGTQMVEVVTYRRKGHAEHDDQRYQPAEELQQWARHDPIDRYTRWLTEQGWADETHLGSIDAKVAVELDTAVAQAEAEPFPDPSTALSQVYAPNPEHPASDPSPLWFRSR